MFGGRSRSADRRNEDVALHAGNWNMNVASIGVENRPEADSDDFATLAELIVDIETKIGHTLYIIGHRGCRQQVMPRRVLSSHSRAD